MTTAGNAPPASGPEQHYREALSRGLFLIQKCGACGRHVFYPRNVCCHCGAQALSFVPASGAGTVYATTTVRQAAEDGGDYNVAVIELAEGPRLMSRVDGCAPQQVAIGLRVTARVASDGGAPILVFELAEDARA